MNMETEIPLVMSVKEMAKILQIGRNAAYEIVNEGKIRCIRIGRNIRIPRKALIEYLEVGDSVDKKVC